LTQKEAVEGPILTGRTASWGKEEKGPRGKGATTWLGAVGITEHPGMIITTSISGGKAEKILN